MKVPKLGPKAYEQCAGFLRVPESKSVLDNTGVHPESYGAAEKLLALCGCGDEDVRRGAVDGLMRKVQAMGEAKIAEEIGVGVPTLRDVVKELMKPGRDLRSDLPAPILRTDVLDMKRLEARHGAHRNGAERDRLRRIRGHRRASGWAGTHLAGVQQVHQAPLRGGGRGRHREACWCWTWMRKTPHQLVHETGGRNKRNRPGGRFLFYLSFTR